MNRVRPLLIAAAVVLVLMAAGVGLALSSMFQTWAFRKTIASHPNLHLTVGRVTAGFSGVDFADLRCEVDGLRIAAPMVHARLPVIRAVLFRRLEVADLSATHCRVELIDSGAARPAASGVPVATLVPDGPKAGAFKDQPAGAFTGILRPLELPFDLSIAHVDISGEIQTPDSSRSAKVSLQGGDIGAGREGAMQVSTSVILARGSVRTIQVDGKVSVGMSTPRSISRIAADFEANATGPSLAAKLKGEVQAARGPAEERYTIAIAGADRQLLKISAIYPKSGGQISGAWKLDMRDRDIAPFMLGRPLPDFATIGEGKLDLDPTFSAAHVIGRLDAAVGNLQALNSQFAEIGKLNVSADIDVAQRGDELSATKLDIAVAVPEGLETPVSVVQPQATKGGKTVAFIRSLQSFEFNPKSGELRATNPASDLVSVRMQGLPLAWLRPFTGDFWITGDDVHGDLLATARAGGFGVRSTVPITVSGVTLVRAGHPLLREVDVAGSISGDYTPQGWQVGVTNLTFKQGSAELAVIQGKAGRLSGKGDPIKTTGVITADVAALAAQPLGQGTFALAHGKGTVEFAATIGARKELQAKVNVSDLAADARPSTDTLPTIAATIRADIDSSDLVALNVPIVLQRDGRKSDIAVVGTLSPKGPPWKFDAQVTSGNLVLDDAKVLTHLLRRAPSGTVSPASTTPIWAGLTGTLTLQLKHVTYPGAVELNNISGAFKFSAGTMDFQNLQTTFGESGTAKTSGVLRFDPAAQPPYGFDAGIGLSDVDAGFLFRTSKTQLLTLVDGKLTIATKVSARAENEDQLAHAVVGKFMVTSKGGTYRGIPVNVGNLVENSGKLRSWLASAGNAIASAGSAITSLAGRKELDEVPTRSQAASELARILSSISYDQLSAVVSRDGENTAVKEFALISPDIRLSGEGRITRSPGATPRDDEVEMTYRIRARGRPAELMKSLGVLDSKPDDLGYAGCSIPVKVTGTLGRLDTTELSNRLVALAVEKTGLTEKAVDWINRLRGKSPQ